MVEILKSRPLTKKDITYLLDNFKDKYEEDSTFIRCISDLVDSEDSINFKESLKDENFIRLKLLYKDKIFYLYHGFPGDNSVGIIVKDDKFLGELGELASNDIKNSKSVKNIIKWYNEITDNCMTFDDDIWK